MKKLDEPWDPIAFKTVYHGGNKAFAEFLEPYRMGKREMEIKILYKSDCGSWWRKHLRAIVYGRKFTQQVPPKTIYEGIDWMTSSIYKGFNKMEKDISEDVKKGKQTKPATDENIDPSAPKLVSDMSTNSLKADNQIEMSNTQDLTKKPEFNPAADEDEL